VALAVECHSDLSNCGRMRGRKKNYSITSSARASKVGGMLRPSVFAVLRLSVLQRDTEKKKEDNKTK